MEKFSWFQSQIPEIYVVSNQIPEIKLYYNPQTDQTVMKICGQDFKYDFFSLWIEKKTIVKRHLEAFSIRLFPIGFLGKVYYLIGVLLENAEIFERRAPPSPLLPP